MLAVFASPFLLMGGGLTLVGLLAVGPRKDNPELCICLPAGLALLGTFAGLAYWMFWRFPRLNITRFAYDGAEVVGSVFLHAATPNSWQLVEQLKTRSFSPDVAPGTS